MGFEIWELVLYLIVGVFWGVTLVMVWTRPGGPDDPMRIVDKLDEAERRKR